MRTKYETLDGNIFTDIKDATKHEEKLLQSVHMWDWDNAHTTNTAVAKLVHLTGEHAGAYFKNMVLANEYEIAPDETVKRFDDEDTGWFYWDEYSECYRYLPQGIIDGIIHATHEI